MKEMETTQLDHSLTRKFELDKVRQLVDTGLDVGHVPTHEKAATVASFQELEAYKNVSGPHDGYRLDLI